MRRPGELALLICAMLLAGAGWLGWLGWTAWDSVSRDAVEIAAPIQAAASPVPQLINAARVAPTPAQPPAVAAPAPAPELEDPHAARDRFDALRWSGGRSIELETMARRIDASLPLLLSRGAVDTGDALMWKADLLEVLEPDPTRRRTQLLAWWREHPLQRDGRNRAGPEAGRREESVLLQWQAQPSEDRDVGELEETLDDLSPEPRP